MNKKVLVMMSGGVDSSVSAILLKNKGYDVCGVTMKLHDNARVLNDINDAKKVCEKIGINHIVVDLSKQFKEKVIDYFIEEYTKGRTPNPCVICNKFIKYGLMIDFAKKNGFDYIASGHYATVVYDDKLNRFLIKRSNEKKDQSYVLFNLKQDDLKMILFPIKGLEKAKIREIARENGLLVADKPESQDICFIKDSDYVQFIKNNTTKKFKPGNFKDKYGNILGKHLGIINYTIGQRKGLGLSFGKPMYVNSINSLKNEIILGEEGSQYKDELLAEDVNFIPFDKLTKEMDVLAKARYKAPLARAKIIPISENVVKVKFYEKQRAITPGQAVVFYDDDILLGGGIIK